MAWFVAQVWVLCAVAFVLGAGVTWLLFVRPLRARPPAAAPPVVAPTTEQVRPVTAPPPAPEAPPAAPAVDPALAALDTPPLGTPRQPGAGVRASGALDLLGVTPSGVAPAIPTQPGPADEDGTRR